MRMLKKMSAVAVFLLCMSTVVYAQDPPPVVPPATTVIVPPKPTAAQQKAAALGRPVSNDQISGAIRTSGLTQAQIKDRLTAAGYSADLADPFFASSGGTAAQPSAQQRSEFASALASLGIMQPDPAATDDVTNAAQEKDRNGGVFGKDVFSGIGSQFDPVTAGPVDASYRIGIGDQLQVVITGEVEAAYQLDIRRDGTVVMPDIGQVAVAGLTLDAARTVLRQRAAGVYNGLNNGTAHLDLSISKVRVNSVFVIGEVEKPGSYQVSALSTVFYALAKAGGPKKTGSFRSVEIRRGGRVLRTIDLYDYLLRGDASNDIRTEQGDIIFVPLNTRAVAISGAIRRPAIFELKANEDFNDLLSFAGGLLPSASLVRVQIDRILPPAQRSPGKDRAKTDIELNGRIEALRSVPLYDFDIITVFSIGDVRRNTVSIGGAVFQPGEYEYNPSMTLAGLIQKAQGALPFAMLDRIKLTRAIGATGQTENISLNLADASAQSFPIEEFDNVLILDSRIAYPVLAVSVSGAVVSPGSHGYLVNESLQDAIDRAGGVLEQAASISLARRRVGREYSDTTSIIYTFALDMQRNLAPADRAFILQPDDRIFVRAAAGYRSQRFATLTGVFLRPGTYALNEQQDRIRDVIGRAGGLLPTAYPGSFRILRLGKRVAIDFARAMSGDTVNNIRLADGDELIIEQDPHTVTVVGAVASPALIVFRPGLSVSDYIELAGGPTEVGNKNKAVVDYPAGYSRRVRRTFFIHSEPNVVSGAVITVPTKPVKTGDTSELWTKLLSTIGTLAVLYAAVTR